MKSTSFAAGGRAGIRPFAGLYLRTPKRTRFWGWGQPPLPAVAAPDEKPFAAVGDWLRAAHSLFGSDRPERAHAQSSTGPAASSSTSPEAARAFVAGEARQPLERKRRLRFVCNRHVIGVVFD